VNAALVDNNGCRGGCFPCECFLIYAFVLAHGLIARDRVLFFKVVAYLNIAGFIIAMSKEPHETSDREGCVCDHPLPSKVHPLSKFPRCDIWPLEVFGNDEETPEREQSDLQNVRQLQAKILYYGELGSRANAQKTQGLTQKCMQLQDFGRSRHRTEQMQ
jgi:hypothetical protein